MEAAKIGQRVRVTTTDRVINGRKIAGKVTDMVVRSAQRRADGATIYTGQVFARNGEVIEEGHLSDMWQGREEYSFALPGSDVTPLD